jgi:hypothetical protein
MGSEWLNLNQQLSICQIFSFDFELVCPIEKNWLTAQPALTEY